MWGNRAAHSLDELYYNKEICARRQTVNASKSLIQELYGPPSITKFSQALSIFLNSTFPGLRIYSYNAE